MYSTCVAFGNIDIAEAAYAIFKANVTLMRVFDVCHCSRSMDGFTMSTALVNINATAAHNIRNVLVENATRPEDRGGDDVSLPKNMISVPVMSIHTIVEKKTENPKRTKIPVDA